MTRSVLALLLGLALLTGCGAEREEAASPEAVAAKKRVRDFWASARRANQLRHAGDFEDAVAEYTRALEMDPNHEESLYYLAASLEAIGEYRRAGEAYERLLRVNPASGRALTQLAQVLATPVPGAVLDPDRARDLLHRAVELNREQIGPFLLLGRLELGEGNLDAALENFHVAAGFGSPEGHAWSGYTLLLAGKRNAARASFAETLAIYRREKHLSNTGISAEGDVLSEAGKPLSALERAGVMAMWFLEMQNLRKPAPVPAKLPAAAGPAALEGIEVEGTVTGAIRTDFDGDGLTDVFVLRWRRPAILFQGIAQGGYRDATEAAGLAGIVGDYSAIVLLDHDQDQRPDLFIANLASYDEALRSLVDQDYEATGCTPRLFRNLGGGHFEETTRTTGLTRCYSTTRAAVKDTNADGFPDILLTNAGPRIPRMGPDVVLLNREGQRFEPRTR